MSGGDLVQLADPHTITAATMTTFAALADMTESLGTYHGRDPSAELRRLDQRAAIVDQRQKHWADRMEREARERAARGELKL